MTKTVAIIGGGFSGTMTAVNLCRLSQQALEVVLINDQRLLGRGTAYGTTRPEHVLNVAARNMSAFPDLPDHFLNWLRTRSEYCQTSDGELRELFAPRRVYGDYLRGLLESCMYPIDPTSNVSVTAIQDEAVDVELRSSNEGVQQAEVILRSRDQPIVADHIVLATGNQPPQGFPSTAPLRHDPRYRSDPWHEWLSRLPAPGGRILLLGTGLTMVDIVLTLTEIGWDGEIVAISRHGMLPMSHFRGIAYDDYVPENATELGLEGLRTLVAQHCERLKQMSQNSAIAVDKLRPHTQRLWQSLSANEKREFLKSDAATWNVTRHRIAIAIHNRVTDALESGRLRLVQGTIQKLDPGEQRIDVVLEDQEGQELTEAGDLVINCTGPKSNFSQSGITLFENLIRRGLVTSDELDMGLVADPDFAVVNAAGEASSVFSAIGPLLKGSLWETTAVPELRGQAMRIAESILEREPATVEQADVIEYYI